MQWVMKCAKHCIPNSENDKITNNQVTNFLLKIDNKNNKIR
ncbi:MAG: hypothetical protein PWQ70_446 [Clostridiales bacterium]|nr:hypothetical protein [Clostridiales bacterium]